jgi:hypothetical protein
MRRISFHRPNAKVRNPERHLRALRKWAQGFDGFYPERTNEKYQNYRIWTLDRLIQGPASKTAWQKEAIKQLLAAAENLISSRPPEEEGKSWVAILLCYPNLWFSEVTVFFDKAYLESFIPPETNGHSIAELYGILVPDKFREVGYEASWDDEDEDGVAFRYKENRLTIYESTL